MSCVMNLVKQVIILSSLCIFTLVFVGCGKKTPAWWDEGTWTIVPVIDQDPVMDEEDIDADRVQNLDTVTVWYKWTLSDGTVFDSNIEQEAQNAWLFDERRVYEPLRFTVGQRQVVPWFEAGVLGMKVWDKKVIEVPKALAYKDTREDLIMRRNRNEVDEELIATWVVGDTYMFDSDFGPIAWRIQEINDTEIVVDMNHELAWKDLIFEVELVSLTKS